MELDSGDVPESEEARRRLQLLLEEHATVARELDSRERELKTCESELDAVGERLGRLAQVGVMSLSSGELQAHEALRRVLERDSKALERAYTDALESVKRARERLEEVEQDIKESSPR